MILGWSAPEHFRSWPGLNTIIAQTAYNVPIICVVEIIQYLILDFKLSSWFECCILSFGWFPGVWIFICRRFGTVISIFICGVSTHEVGTDSVLKRRHIKIQTPGNHLQKYNDISYLLLLYPHVVQTFSWKLCFQTPVIYTVLKDCSLQDITSLFKLQRKYAMSVLASLLVESNESHTCVTRWGP
jgi:hypothetical protein